MTTLEQDTFNEAKTYCYTDWEQRRFEAALAMLPFCAKDATDEAEKSDDPDDYLAMTDVANHCRAAIEYADELIKQLKGND